MPERLSKSQIDKLGERLRTSNEVSVDDLTLLQQVRAEHDAAMAVVADRLASELGLEPGTRLKTVGTIVDKLRRERMRLSQMQDIAGVRVVHRCSSVWRTYSGGASGTAGHRTPVMKSISDSSAPPRCDCSSAISLWENPRREVFPARLRPPRWRTAGIVGVRRYGPGRGSSTEVRARAAISDGRERRGGRGHSGISPGLGAHARAYFKTIEELAELA